MSWPGTHLPCSNYWAGAPSETTARWRRLLRSTLPVGPAANRCHKDDFTWRFVTRQMRLAMADDDAGGKRVTRYGLHDRDDGLAEPLVRYAR